VEAASLLINGEPATGVVNHSNITHTFRFSQPTFGPVKIAWSSNTASWTSTRRPSRSMAAPQAPPGIHAAESERASIQSKTPAADETLTRLTEITVTFNKPAKGVDAADLLLNEMPATGVRGSDTTYAFTFPSPLWSRLRGVGHQSWHHGPEQTRESVRPVLAEHSWSYGWWTKHRPYWRAGSARWFCGDNLTQLTVTFTEPVAASMQ